ncbi:TPA: hypothetical protein EYP66_13215 [Candidatus Poribacteria bacterium]|nr:hypothetical protein [Candidatus Poribacteria bacterium]
MKVTIARLTLICVSLIFINISSAKIDPGTIVGLWLFDEGAGDVARDSSKYGNDGNLFNSALNGSRGSLERHWNLITRALMSIVVMTRASI